MRNIIIFILIFSTSALAYNFDDVNREFIPTGKEMQSMVNIMNFYVKLQRDERAIEFFSFMRDCMEDFDFDEIYESSYLTPIDNGYHSLWFYGHNKPEFYELELPPTQKKQKQIKNSGDYIAELGLRKNDATLLGRYRSFSAYIKSETAWKDFSIRNVIFLLEGFAKVFDPTNIEKLNAPDSPLLKQLEKDAPVVYANISSDLRKVLNEYYKTNPNHSNFIYRYFVPTAPLEVFKIKKYNTIPYTHIKAKLPFNIELIERDFPDLADYMEDLRENFRVSVVLRTTTGNTLLKAVINSTVSMDLEIYTRLGKVVPFDSNGTPIFSEEFLGSKLKNYKCIAALGMMIKQFGLQVDMDIICDGEYKSNSSKTIMGGKITDSKSTISGNFLGFIPPAVINVLMPGNMDQLMSDYFEVLIKANNGEGSIGKFEWDTKKSNNVISYFDASTELLDCFLIRFGMKMVLSRFVKDEESRDQLEVFLKDFVMTWLTDIQNSGDKVVSLMLNEKGNN